MSSTELTANSAPRGAAQWRAWLTEQIAAVTGAPLSEHDAHRPLLEFGVSSRDAVALVARAGELLGRELPGTLVWSAPTIAELAEVLAGDPAGRAMSGAPGPRRAAEEDVAVVGLACRMPGAHAAEEFWRLLRDGRSAIGAVPAGRWERFVPDVAERDLPARGGFLDDVAGFDAEFFGISPGEAEVVDPQQRLLLEVVWEALAHAGIPAGSLRGTDCGVFVGLSATEYAQLTMTDLDRIDTWSATGAAASIAANRVSYQLGVHGPSLTTDTACSSSLVAVHQAVRALVDGEASAAIACGVNLLLSPAITQNFHRAGLLSADGRCKPFDAAADGIVRGEGCGAVVLKRLGDAERDQDRILAVIKGSAVNSDGRSNGLMAPNPAAQQQVLARAYHRAGLRARSVDYVEAHGTGTLLGDPVEAGALAAVLGAGRRPRQPLLIGSVKSNIGHLEGAAGIAGLIKVVLGLRHGRIPPTLNFTAPNPGIDFTGLAVVTEGTEWPRYSGVARAGVSSFGFGGTNAHVVVEEWPRTPPPVRRDSPGRPEVVVVSGRSPERLRTRARALADWLDGHRDEGIAAIAAACAHACDDEPARAAVSARDNGELAERLRRIAGGAPVRTAEPRGPGPVFVFSGYGSQWPGMGRRLLAEEPAFARAVDGLAPAFRRIAGVELADLLSGVDDGTDAPVSIEQLALFGTQVALAELWQAHGVQPAAVLGHSMGEVAAAVVIGALEPDDGLRVMLHRTGVLDELQARGAGAMAAVGLSADEVAELAERFDGVAVAVHASPAQCTVTGPADQVRALVDHVVAGGGLARVLLSGAASHSAAVEPLLDGFTTALGGLRPAPGRPEVACYSSVLDDPRRRPDFGAGYWAANLREQVRFTQAVAAAVADGHRRFIEIAPHPVVAAAIEQTAAATGVDDVAVIPTLRRDPGGTTGGFAAALADVSACDGAAVLRRRYPRVVLDLPAPVWQHRHYWVDTGGRAGARSGHPFLGEPVEVPGAETRLWRAEIGSAAHPWMERCAVAPAAVLVELMLAAARAVSGANELRDVVLHEPLPLADRTVVSVAATPARDRGLELAVSAKVGGAWTCCATAAASASVEALEGAIGAHLSEVRHPDGHGNSGFALHPALAEDCLRALVPPTEDGQARRVLRIGRVHLAGDPRQVATVARSGPRSLRLLDRTGAVLAGMDDVELTEFSRAEIVLPPERLAFGTSWVPAEPAPGGSGRSGDWLVLHSPDADPAPLLQRLSERGRRAIAAPLDRCGELTGLVEGCDALAGVVVLPPTPGSPGAFDEARGSVLATAAVVGQLTELTGRGWAPPRLWLVTSGAFAVRPDEAGRPAVAALRGLVRVLAYEHPELHVTAADFDHGSPAGAPELVPELLSDPPEDELAWRGGRRFAHVVDQAALPSGQPRVPVVGDGAYVITGGLGGLGIEAARWLASAGAGRIVLSGRRPPSARARDAIEEITARGSDVEVVTGDLTEPGIAGELVRAATAGGVALRGVLHAAGALADSAVLATSSEDLATAWRAKAEGALLLHEACAGSSLDWWLSYSSAAALFGSPGQAAYATANAWLDSFTTWQRAQGVPASAIQWGAWARIGAAVGKHNPVLEPMPPREAMAALPAVLASGRAHTAITRLRTDVVLEMFPGLADRPFFSELIGAARPEPGGSEGTAAAAELRALSEEDPERAGEAVADHVASLIAEMMWLDSASLDRHAPLTSLGVDSLLAMRARGALERDFGLTLPLPMLLRGATIADVAEHVVAVLRGGDRAPQRRAGRGPGPRDFAERWVAGEVARALGLADGDLGVHVPLTEVGMDGEAAERLLAAIGNGLARPVTRAELLAKPTIAGMAEVLREEVEGAVTGPVRALGGGGGAPLYLFHAAGSPTAVYRPFVAQLRSDATCFGMERLDELRTVESKAARYAEIIRQQQPTGPYRLGGWSFGGLLAFETAQRLASAGHEIELLFLIDTILPLPPAEHAPERARLRRFVDYVEQTYQVDLGLPDGELAALPEPERDALVMRRLAERVAAMGPAVLEHQRTSYLDAQIAEQYTPRHYPGRVLLFRAKDPHPLTTALDPRYLRTDDALGWDEFCPRLETVKVHGDHITVVDMPHVAVVAERVSDELDRREPAVTPPHREKRTR
ncbi:type I polyketide synthase [Saccharopolyspora hirsuta]|uniref:SDR family NAD(P)-dependent oxidoreductase n=1 Tax=Saccharopolyspora hirsuta TaxID=1837 RepID=A0A5M7BF12_SACHI|nr:type I polyketide synthase [Saccharopolyspora hirsuta]KAA5827128.1 SDR family NAD(P)-dependent oxidoreductase [Saccharopolyspora hirsuta]